MRFNSFEPPQTTRNGSISRGGFRNDAFASAAGKLARSGSCACAQYDAIRVGYAQRRRQVQVVVGLVGMGGKEAKQAGAFEQAGKPPAVVLPEPAIKGAGADTFERKEQGQGDQFTGIQMRIRMFGHIDHRGIDPIKQGNDKSPVDMRTSTRE